MENKYIEALKEIDKIIIDNNLDNTSYDVCLVYYKIQEVIKQVLKDNY